MSNQMCIYLLQSDEFLQQPISEQAFATFVEEETSNRLLLPATDITTPLLPWLQAKLAGIQAEEITDFDELEVIDFVRDRLLGIYHLTDFQRAGILAIDLEHLYPLLPERFHPRIEYIWGNGGSPLPPETTTDLTILNEVHPTWTFFTRQEIIDIRPIVLGVIEDETVDFYDQEWHQVITAHERYAYDWLAFFYQF